MSQGRTYPLTSNWAVIFASLFSAFFLAASLYISAHRPLWYDEILTELVSRQSWPGGAFQLLKMGVDQQPLPYYLVVKLSQQIFGASGLALRVPSALALWVGLLITFDCTRRLTDAWYGLLALILLTCTRLPYYGVEARPYALVFMWTACSLWLWLHTPTRSKVAALCFGVTIFGAITSHCYAVFCLVPFGLSALLNIRKEALPPKLITGSVGAIAGLALMLPLIQALHGALHGLIAAFWAPATSDALEETFAGLFPHSLILLPLMLVWVAVCSVYRPKVAAIPINSAERLAWLFLLVPFAGFVVAKLVTNAFYHRYFIGILPGVAVGFSCLMWRHFRSQWVASAGILCLLAVFGVARCVAHVRNPDWDDPAAIGEIAKLHELMQVEELSLRDGKHFLVLPLDSMLAIEILYQSRHPDRYRFLDDPSSLIPVYCRVNKTAGQFLDVPMRLWHLNDLKEHAQEAVLIEAPDKTMLSVQQMGISLEFRRVTALQRLMYLQRVRF
jgi:4-amino-4-deoxy-L-arabinose transferase-like glycosyltransferase